MRPPKAQGPRPGSRRGFTLIELLTVVALVIILAAIAFPLITAGNRRAAVSRARADLEVIANALEEYKRTYGDYPQTGSFDNANPAPASEALATNKAEVLLANALFGKLGPRIDGGTSLLTVITKPRFGGSGTLEPTLGRVFLEASRFSLETTNLPDADDTAPALNAFLDPWGNRYQYKYRDGSSATAARLWTSPGFILWSTGPDGRDDVGASGVVNDDGTLDALPGDSDDIIAGRN